MKHLVRLTAIGLFALLAPHARAADAPYPVRVVIVTTYENGNDTADAPGELQYWAERERLTERLEFPGGVHPILSNADHTVIAVLTGMSKINAATSLMALGADSRFDLKDAYWLVAGCAGIDPAVGSVGSAVWVRSVLNDIAQSVDPRDLRAGTRWPYGIFPAGSSAPNRLTPADAAHGPEADYPIVFDLNPGLTRWAYALTRTVALPQDAVAYSARWSQFAGAMQPPQVLIGDNLTSDMYWHGARMNQYARDWVALYTGGKGRFAVSEMEDAALAGALNRLDHAGKARFSRLLILRTASNFTMPPPGGDVVASLTEDYPGKGSPAFESAWRVGSMVLHQLTGNWDQYKDATPSAP